jgi:hypothetical protein
MIHCAAVPKAAVPGPRLLTDVLPAPLFESFRFYVDQLQRTGALRWEEWGRRHVRHNDPFAVLVHQALRPRLEETVGRPVKPSYSFVACYADGGRVPAHVDRAQCRYTLDLCLEGDGEWPLFVAGRPYALRPNQALVYRGCELEHHRETKPAGARAHLVFFHFVDPDFDGPLD